MFFSFVLNTHKCYVLYGERLTDSLQEPERKLKEERCYRLLFYCYCCLAVFDGLHRHCGFPHLFFCFYVSLSHSLLQSRCGSLLLPRLLLLLQPERLLLLFFFLFHSVTLERQLRTSIGHSLVLSSSFFSLIYTAAHFSGCFWLNRFSTRVFYSISLGLKQSKAKHRLEMTSSSSSSSFFHTGGFFPLIIAIVVVCRGYHVLSCRVPSIPH